ncbi:MAG: hypothetical protein HYV08_16925 [Deltaproteobacteria bacterium]|nr:hypothetical protein [Deltaproteobacteria bacterium]MBI3079577.1 hypothetical protein [Deltaproteobacteria bacterium]
MGAGLPPLTVARRLEGWSLLLDLRSVPEFEAGHPAGAVHVQFSRKSLPERVATALPEPAPPLILCAADGIVAEAAAGLLQEAACFQVDGWLDGGLPAWAGAGLPTATLPRLTLEGLQRRLAPGGLVLVDVREPFEWRWGYIPGARLIPLDRLALKPEAVAGAPELAFICEDGVRSSTAASLLMRRGHRGVANVTEGMNAWYRMKLPTMKWEGRE